MAFVIVALYWRFSVPKVNLLTDSLPFILFYLCYISFWIYQCGFSSCPTSAAGFVQVPLLVSYLPFLNLPTLVNGRFFQIYKNAVGRDCGDLSAITHLLMFLGTVARIFTTLVRVETAEGKGDNKLVAGYALGATLNAILVGQILLYKKKEIVVGEGAVTKKAEDKKKD